MRLLLKAEIISKETESSCLKKASKLLKEPHQPVEPIAANVGYENVEHFNRLFKKAYDMTPVQYRKQSAE